MLEINKIYNMDCVEGMKMLPDECIDLTVTSPPYVNLEKRYVEQLMKALNGEVVGKGKTSSFKCGIIY